MKKFLVFFIVLFVGFSVYAQVVFSGNVYTGFRADFSKDVKTIYANEDANGTPIWTNFRMDYSLEPNAGMTINFRTKGTDTVSSSSPRFYPFLNRGFVWVKSNDGMFRARSGYLWDLDFETNGGGWDTASSYEWTSEFVMFPTKDLEVGFVVPTAYNKSNFYDAMDNITYGVVYSPTNFRFSAMGEYGSIDANRSFNFGVDYTGVKNLTLRVEGDLQQVGINNVGYNQLYQAVSYTNNGFTPGLSVAEYFYKDGTETKINSTVSGKVVDKTFTYYGEFAFNFNPSAIDNAYKQVKVSVQKDTNAKSHVKAGSYFNKASSDADLVVSPFVEFFASF
jgi:hypothetical protein